MKNIIKTVAAILLIAAMSMSFTGCILIDDLRESQGYFDEKDNVVVNGETYKKLPSCSFLFPDYGFISSDEYKSVYITDKDVPVLLSVFFGNEVSISADGNFIETWVNDSSYYATFCKEDIYGDVLEIIENGVDSGKFKYGIWNPNNGNYEERILTDEESKALEAASKEGKIKDNVDELLDYDAAYANISEFEEDLPFSVYRCDVSVINNKYYIQETVVPEDLQGVERDEYISNGYDVEYVWKEVPEKYNGIFEKIMDKAILEAKGPDLDKFDDTIYW